MVEMIQCLYNQYWLVCFSSLHILFTNIVIKYFNKDHYVWRQSEVGWLFFCFILTCIFPPWERNTLKVQCEMKLLTNINVLRYSVPLACGLSQCLSSQVVTTHILTFPIPSWQLYLVSELEQKHNYQIINGLCSTLIYCSCLFIFTHLESVSVMDKAVNLLSSDEEEKDVS